MTFLDLFELNRFQVVINLVAGLGYYADRIFKVPYQRAKAAASSAQEEGAYLRIRCDIFGGEVFFFVHLRLLVNAP